MKQLRNSLSERKNTTRMSNQFQVPTTQSAIHNKIELTYTDLIEDKRHIEKMIKLAVTAEELVNLINYRAYELRYDFYKKIDSLDDKLNTLRRDSYYKANEIVNPYAIINMENENQRLAQQFERNDRKIKDALMNAQRYHEHCIDDLDTTLKEMKWRFDNLKMLLEASVVGQGQKALEDQLVMDLEYVIDRFIQMQTKDWHSVIKRREKFEHQGKKVNLTNRGLLETSSGQTLTYKEVRDNDLLKGADIFNTTEEVTSSSASSTPSKTSLNERHSCDESEYIKNSLGTPLTLALAEIAAVQPKDPIHYLGHWLFKYRYNQEASERQINEMQLLNLERTRIAEERWRRMVDEEVREVIMQMITRMEEEAFQRELSEIERIRKETDVEEEMIDKDLEEEARDKFDTYGTGVAT